LSDITPADRFRLFARDDSRRDLPPPADESRLGDAPPPNGAAARDALVDGTHGGPHGAPGDRARTRWFLEFARAELCPVPIDALRAADCVGRYEALHVVLEQGTLALAPEGEAEAILRPFPGEPDVFYLPAVPEIRVRFLRDARGGVTALRVFSWEGEPRDHRRAD
jgi:hypothetical protein